MPKIPWIISTTGVNDKIDPARLRYDKETGISELATAVDVDITDSGLIAFRLGQDPVSDIPSHSLFSDGGDAFVAQDRTADTALYRIGTDFSLSGVRSGLTKGEKIGFCQVGAKTFYSNGIQNGVVEEGISSPWPTSAHVGPETTRQFSDAPLGKHLAYFMGRMWIAEGNILWASEPYALGKFNKAKCFFQFGTDIRLLKAVARGLWISTADETGFILLGESFDGLSFISVSNTPAHEDSVNVRLVDLSRTVFEIPGLSAVWSSDEGLCLGTPDGRLINATEAKLIYPTGSVGATVVHEDNAINSTY